MIYVLQDVSERAVKVGFSAGEPELSAGLKRRMSQLQQGNPRELVVCALAPGDTERDEKRMHHLFSRHRRRGEWFSICDAVAEYVENYRIEPVTVRQRWGNAVFVGRRKSIIGDLQSRFALEEDARMAVERAAQAQLIRERRVVPLQWALTVGHKGKTPVRRPAPEPDPEWRMTLRERIRRRAAGDIP